MFTSSSYFAFIAQQLSSIVESMLLTTIFVTLRFVISSMSSSHSDLIDGEIQSNRNQCIVWKVLWKLKLDQWRAYRVYCVNTSIPFNYGRQIPRDKQNHWALPSPSVNPFTCILCIVCKSTAKSTVVETRMTRAFKQTNWTMSRARYCYAFHCRFFLFIVSSSLLHSQSTTGHKILTRVLCCALCTDADNDQDAHLIEHRIAMWR